MSEYLIHPFSFCQFVDQLIQITDLTHERFLSVRFYIMDTVYHIPWVSVSDIGSGQTAFQQESAKAFAAEDGPLQGLLFVDTISFFLRKTSSF